MVYYQVPSSVDLTQGQLVVVPVVEDVHQICVERVDVLQLWKLGQNDGQLLVEAGLRKLDLAHVESPDSADLEVPVHHRRRLPLRLGQDDVGEVLRRRDDGNLLEVVVRHLCNSMRLTCREGELELPASETSKRSKIVREHQEVEVVRSR